MLLLLDNVDDLTAQERAARVAVEIATTGQITNKRARELTGLSMQAVYYLLCALSRRVFPMAYDEKEKIWYVESSE